MGKLTKRVEAFGSKFPNRFKRIKSSFFRRRKETVSTKANLPAETPSLVSKNERTQLQDEGVSKEFLFIVGLSFVFLFSVFSDFYLAFFLLFSLYLGKTFNPKTKKKMVNGLILKTLFWLMVICLVGAKTKQAQAGDFVLSYSYYFGKSLAVGLLPAVISFFVSYYYVKKKYNNRKVKWTPLWIFVTLAIILALIGVWAKVVIAGIGTSGLSF